jgi:RNA polymerase sigma factor (sigma-70 family)
VSTAVSNIDASAIVDLPGPSWSGASRSRTSLALLKTQSDARLCRLAADGYEAAFETLICRYRGPLHRYARRFLSDALTEDVVQQAFMDLWAVLGEGEEIRNARAWLYRVVRNAALNTIRRAGHRCEELQEAVDADSTERAFERRAAVREALAGLASLPAVQREAMMRNAVDGHSRTQIASAMGLSDGAVGQILYRARCSLRSAMSAIVPLPLVCWAVGRPGYDPSTAARILQLTTTGASGGPAGVLLRGGAALAVIAAASTAPLIATPARHPERPAAHVALPVSADALLAGSSDPLHPFVAPRPARDRAAAGRPAAAARPSPAPAQGDATPLAAAASDTASPAEDGSAQAPASESGTSAAAETAETPAEAPAAETSSAPEPVAAEAAPAELEASEAPPAEAPAEAPAAAG